MGTPERCSHCGAARGAAGDRPAASRPQVLEALYQEVARIREVAERREEERSTIEALSQEIRLLRETVARLRGTTVREAARTSQAA